MPIEPLSCPCDRRSMVLPECKVLKLRGHRKGGKIKGLRAVASKVSLYAADCHLLYIQRDVYIPKRLGVHRKCIV